MNGSAALRILLVEDDALLGDGLRAGLLQGGANLVDWASDAAAARLALTDHAYTAVLLDLGLPDRSGHSVLESMRARLDPTPVLVISAHDHLSERLKALDAGADDYLVKPFPLDELLARLRAVLRRSTGTVLPLLSYRDVAIETATRSVTRDGTPVALSLHEYLTLQALMQRQGHTLTRHQLEDAVYGDHGTIESNTIAVYIHQLRRKLGDDLIVTVHGYGYRLGEANA